MYPNSGITFENNGVIIFKGKCSIANDTHISVGKNGVLEFGDDVLLNAGVKLAAHHSITFGNKVRVGYGSFLVDTDFHQMKYANGEKGPKAYAPIKISDNCFVGSRSTVLKRTFLPAKCTLASNSMANKIYDCEEMSILAGPPAKVVRTGIYRDVDDDLISYE